MPNQPPGPAGGQENSPVLKRPEKRFAAELDVTGMLCPMPILRARRKLDDLAVGDMLLVIASDPAVVRDMPAFCTMAGHTLVMAHMKAGKYLFEIEKGALGE